MNFLSKSYNKKFKTSRNLKKSVVYTCLLFKLYFREDFCDDFVMFSSVLNCAPGPPRTSSVCRSRTRRSPCGSATSRLAAQTHRSPLSASRPDPPSRRATIASRRASSAKLFRGVVRIHDSTFRTQTLKVSSVRYIRTKDT